MATINGTKAAIFIGGTKTTGDRVPGVISFTIPEQSRIDVTTAGKTRTVSILGLKAGEISADCYLDQSEAALESAITNGTDVDAYFYADIDENEIESINCYVTRSVNTSGPNAAVKCTLTFSARV
jgi:hypothetical protein